MLTEVRKTGTLGPSQRPLFRLKVDVYIPRAVRGVYESKDLYRQTEPFVLDFLRSDSFPSPTIF